MASEDRTQQRHAAQPDQHGHAGAGRPARGEHDRWDGAFEFSQPEGSQLELREFTVKSLEASQVVVEKCAVGRVRGGTVTLDRSGAAVAFGRDIRIKQGGGAILAGGKITVEQGGGQWLIGGLVQAKQIFAITVIAARVEGQVKCLFDARGAFAFGAGAALMTGLLKLLLFRRR